MSAFLRKYGTGTGADVIIPLIVAGGTSHATSGDWTPVAGDVKVSKDGAAAANIGTLPTYITSIGWKFVFADAELQCARLNIQITDAAVENDHFIVETYGNASAQHAVDLDDSVRAGLTALPNAAADAAGGLVISDAGGQDIDTKLSYLTGAVATAAKLLAYVQLLARSDAAIATDRATELGEVNANQGSGAGNWDNTTDSEEAIRDWIGDGTNLTEAGGTGDHLTAIDLPNQTMDITGNLSGSVGSVTGGINTSGGTITTLDALDTAQDSQHSTTQAAVAGLNNLSAAQVNAEVVDVIRTDTASELAAVPAASPNLHAMIQWIYMRFRNKETSSSSAATVANDAGTVIGTSTVTDSAGTLTKSKYS